MAVILPDNGGWASTIPGVDVTDPCLGGVSGPLNTGTTAIAGRTKFLRDNLAVIEPINTTTLSAFNILEVNGTDFVEVASISFGNNALARQAYVDLFAVFSGGLGAEVNGVAYVHLTLNGEVPTSNTGSLQLTCPLVSSGSAANEVSGRLFKTIVLPANQVNRVSIMAKAGGGNWGGAISRYNFSNKTYIGGLILPSL